jgi:peptidylprolyl isomerase
VRRLFPAALLLAAVAGCGASSGASQFLSDGTSDATSATESPAIQGPVAPTGPTACASAAPQPESVVGTTDLTKKPEIEVPDAPPPCNLVVGDIVRGSGAAAKAGDQLTMKYVGALYSTGKQFDASWDNGQDFPFILGGGNVIAGWDQGMVGMKVGGRRQLIIPPALGYGDAGAGADIPAGATLIFVVDLVRIG